MYLRNTSDITSQSDEGNKGSDKANTNGKNRQENENNDTSGTCKKLPSNKTTSKDNGRRDCASSEVQSSASPTSNPLHLEYPHSLQQPDYANKSSSDATVGNGSVVEEDQDHPHSLHELDSASNESSLQENSGNGSAVEEDPVPPCIDQDQQKDHPHILPEPDNANESSLQDSPTSSERSLLDELSDSSAFLPEQDNTSSLSSSLANPRSLLEPANANRENALQPKSSDINPAQDQRVNQMTCGLPVRVNTNNEGPLQYNPGSAALDQEDAVLPRVNGKWMLKGN